METWHNCHLDESKCLCHGAGWIPAGPSFDECPIHFEGQLHPDSKALLLDDVKALREAESKAKLRWLLVQNNLEISYFEKKLAKAKESKSKLEKELMQKTTTRMPAVRL